MLEIIMQFRTLGLRTFSSSDPFKRLLLHENEIALFLILETLFLNLQVMQHHNPARTKTLRVKRTTA